MQTNKIGIEHMTRQEILDLNPLTQFLERIGINGPITNRCPVAEHKIGHPCVSIDVERQLWHCNDHDRGGTIIDWLMCESGKTAKEVMLELQGAQNASEPSGNTKVAENKQSKITAIYDYIDQDGQTVFQVVRYEPKSFRQRRPDGEGGWISNLDGVTRVIYNLPKVLSAQEVVITEGEKDCKTLEDLGFIATCNAGGANSWLAAYGDYLKGKDVIIIPDNDDPGKKWTEAVVASLEDKANSVKVVHLPAKDVTEWVESKPAPPPNVVVIGNFPSATLRMIIDKTAHRIKPLPLYTMQEMEVHYREFVKHSAERSFDLKSFIPAFGSMVRPLVPGELALLIADTGVGKSLICQGIARAANPLPTIFFELELPLDLMFERFVQIETGCYGHEVAQDYKENDESFIDAFKGLHHIIVCPESGLTTAQIESYILRSELKFGKKPVLVIVDYIGLVRGGGRGRYESVSDAAESLKVIAKRTGTIVFMVSQVSRPDKQKKNHEVSLHDAKDSGSLENSAGLILGCWRPDRNRLVIKILKNTKGFSGQKVECEFDGARMQIKEIK